MPKSQIVATTAAVKDFYRTKARAAGAVGGSDGTGYALLVADLIGAIVDGATGGSAAGALAGGANIFAGFVTSGETAAIPNPMFIANGHDEPIPCPLTDAYLASRVWKGIGGGSLGLIGIGASAATGGVNAVDVVMHGNAAASTAAHLMHLGLIARSYRQTQTISGWISAIVAIKTAKLAIRGGQTAAALVPAASLPVAVVAMVAKTGIKMTATNACLMTAMAIHWRAYQEQVIGTHLGGGGRNEGPATRIFVELLKRRGLTRIFGRYDPVGMIREPAGWQVLGDKILLI